MSRGCFMGCSAWLPAYAGGAYYHSRIPLTPEPTGRPVTTKHYRLEFVLFLLALALLSSNVLLFTVNVANPLIISDGWTFVDKVVRKSAEGHFAWQDIFFKRSAMDHSQPLRKLILLFHYRYFDLDFSIEAIAGLLFGFLNIALLWGVARHGRGDTRPSAGELLGFAALAAVYFSLNATTVYSYPLMTLSYSSHTFILMMLVCAWFALANPRWNLVLLLAAAALAMNVVADDTGIIVTIACLLVILLQVFRGAPRRRALHVAMVVAGACVAYNIGYDMLLPQPQGAGGKLDFAGLLGRYSQAWQLSIPFTASVVHLIHLREWFGAGAGIAAGLIAIVVMAAHGWFWWKALTGPRNLASFVAIALMLMFYGLVAGILLGRVGAKGVMYLWQPRYTLLYEWNIVALLLMALAQFRPAVSMASSTSPSGAAVAGAIPERALMSASALLLVLQVPLSVDGWQHVRPIQVYQQRMATKIGSLALDADPSPTRCMPQMVVCHFPESRRKELMRFLEGNQLNLFSPSFQKRHQLYPGPGATTPSR